MIDAGKIYLKTCRCWSTWWWIIGMKSKWGSMDWPEIPSGTFQDRPGKKISGNGDMVLGGRILGGTPCVMIEPKGVKLPEGVLAF